MPRTKQDSVVDYFDEQHGELVLTRLFKNIANEENCSFFYFFVFLFDKRKRSLKDGDGVHLTNF